MLATHLFWPCMWQDDGCYIYWWTICIKLSLNLIQMVFVCLFMFLVHLGRILFMNFVLGLPRTKRKRDNIFVVIDHFSKMVCCIVCHKCDNASHIVELFLTKIIHLYVVSTTIVSKRDALFLSHSWRTLWYRLGTKLFFLLLVVVN